MDELRIICIPDAVIEFISYENLLHRCEKNCAGTEKLLIPYFCSLRIRQSG